MQSLTRQKVLDRQSSSKVLIHLESPTAQGCLPFKSALIYSAAVMRVRFKFTQKLWGKAHQNLFWIMIKEKLSCHSTRVSQSKDQKAVTCQMPLKSSHKLKTYLMTILYFKRKPCLKRLYSKVLIMIKQGQRNAKFQTAKNQSKTYSFFYLIKILARWESNNSHRLNHR